MAETQDAGYEQAGDRVTCIILPACCMRFIGLVIPSTSIAKTSAILCMPLSKLSTSYSEPFERSAPSTV